MPTANFYDYRSLPKHLLGFCLMLMTSPSLFASVFQNQSAASNFFDISPSGGPIKITLCLNIKGSAPLSCQNYSTQTGELNIKTTIPGHTYNNAGMRINSQGFHYSQNGSPHGVRVNPNRKSTYASGFIPLEAVSQTMSSSGLIEASTSTDFPVIKTSPANQTVAAGQSATFKVTATGAPPLSYQWRKQGLAIIGATASNFTIPNVSLSDNQSVFSVVVSNASGSVMAAAKLTVTPSNSTAVLVGDNNATGFSNTSLDQGVNWQANAYAFPGATNLKAVACFGQSCTAVGSNNDSEDLVSFISQDGAMSWTPSTTPPPGKSNFIYSSAVQSASCTALQCVSVGYHNFNDGCYSMLPAFFSSTDGGNNWGNLTPLSSNPENQTGSLSGVSCSESTCAAVGNNGSGKQCTFKQKKTVSIDPNIPLSYFYKAIDSSWNYSTTQPPLNDSGGGIITGVSCSGQVCVAVGVDLNAAPLAYRSTDAGDNWTLITTQPPLNDSGGGSLNSVSCNGQSCTAVGRDNSSPSLPLTYVSTDGGDSWSLSTTQPPINTLGGGTLTHVACASTQCTCVGNDNNNNAISYVSSDGGNTWNASTTQPTGSGTLNDVALMTN